ncbi:type II toxin-antitoxin system RelE/ParE family toxin [Streptomyces uncialis]|uniref:type II toxin-antitoxin system RelE family toxin n=1 Tax=Streptomyces uncialis TaxID=1048205 RepID=UPI003650D00F
MNQGLDSVNLLPTNPCPSGAKDYGGGNYRLRVGRYRVWHTITQNKPVVIAIDLVGRVR